MKLSYKYYNIIMLISLVFLIGIVSAETNPCGNSDSFLGTFKQSSNINLYQTCDSCSYVNLTNIQTPTTSNNYNLAMQKSGTNFNYTINSSSELGCYSYTVCGDKSGTFICETIDFEVTPNGDQMETSQSLMYIILLVINLLFLTIFIILAVKIPYENEKTKDERGRESVVKVTKSKYLKIICVWFSIGLFLWFITIITGMVNNYISFQPLKDMIVNLYFFTQILSYCVSTGIVWLIFYNIWKDIILNKIILKEGKAILNKL